LSVKSRKAARLVAMYYLNAASERPKRFKTIQMTTLPVGSARKKIFAEGARASYPAPGSGKHPGKHIG
jgi:hypothetical protein